MAEPIPFPQQNANLVAPSDRPEVSELPVYRGERPPTITSKWRLTKPEIDEVCRTGIVWLHVLGDRMPPVAITVDDPFREATQAGPTT